MFFQWILNKQHGPLEYSNVLCLGTLRKEAYIQFMPQ